VNVRRGGESSTPAATENCVSVAAAVEGARGPRFRHRRVVHGVTCRGMAARRRWASAATRGGRLRRRR
jgi:hypothetical protein